MCGYGWRSLKVNCFWTALMSNTPPKVCYQNCTTSTRYADSFFAFLYQGSRCYNFKFSVNFCWAVLLLSHSHGITVGMATSGLMVAWSSDLVQWEVSQQQLEESPCKFVQTFMLMTGHPSGKATSIFIYSLWVYPVMPKISAKLSIYLCK